MTMVPTYAPINDLPAPVTSGSTIQTFTDVYGDVWVAANGVYGGAWRRARDVLALHVYVTVANALASAAFTKVNFNAVRTIGAWSGDPYSLWSTSNYSFACPLAGRYYIAARTGSGFTAAAYRAITSVFQNGGEARRGPDIYGASSTEGSSFVSTDIMLSLGDVVDIRHYSTPAGNSVATGVQSWLDLAYLGTG